MKAVQVIKVKEVIKGKNVKEIRSLNQEILGYETKI